MKIIDPLHPDINPDEAPVPTQNPAPVPQTAPIPAQEPVMPQPSVTQAATEQHSTPPPSHPIYPTPLSFEEKRTQSEQAGTEAASSRGASLSQFFIPVIVGLYALYSIFGLIKIAFAGSGLLFINSFGSGFGAYSRMIWMMLIFGLILSVAALIISYRIYQGSKVALALLTGPLVIYLMYATTMTAYTALISSFNRSSALIGLSAKIVLAIMLILAWTKDKKHYT